MCIRDSKKPFTFDLETTMDNNERRNIICIGLGLSGSDAVCIPLVGQWGKVYWKDDAERRVIAALAKLFASDCEKIGQNVFVFDIPVLQQFNIKVAPPVHDTLVIHHVIDPEIPHSLNFLGSVYTDMPKHKVKFKSMLAVDDYTLRYYNGSDCLMTWRVLDELAKELNNDRK